MENGKKLRVLFPFVEAGLGHIMPLQAIADAFEKKYGNRYEVVRVSFFQDSDNAQMKKTEQYFIDTVKRQNKNNKIGDMMFFALGFFGSRLSMWYLMEKQFRKSFRSALDYMTELKPDLVVNTHFSTLYYACETVERGMLDCKIVNYCPDPVVGKQWDNRCDIMGLSSEAGKKKAIKSKRFLRSQMAVIPFLIREKVSTMTEGRLHYRRLMGLDEDKFTVLLADGAYGAGKLKETVHRLLKSDRPMSIVAVCGRNEKLYQEFLALTPPAHISFYPFGFTDKMLELSAACDLFVGKAGASNLAEPAYFGAPQIITFRATPIERWIAEHYTEFVKSAVLEENIKKVVALVESFIDDPAAMQPYVDACESQHRYDGPEVFADIINDLLEAPSASPVYAARAQRHKKSYRRRRI